MDDPISIDEPPHFNVEDWIGCAILMEQQDKGVGSKLERVAQWRSEGNEMAIKAEVVTGNVANAASVAKQVAKTVL